MDYTQTQRFEALAYYFGWQGGTCHQLDGVTGCKDVIGRAFAEADDAFGWFAVRTCSISHRVNVLAPEHQGDWNYWCGVVRGYWTTGALGGPDYSARFGN
jgi:hypothetical protein